ncbi:hypothetical protein INT45_011965 [Circinella minor]|uniref:PH domain-containing protein n=1 Tax=Circinella minor TaxID=1195481 RepID=A0A8H7SER0_9FUNG|nr:hypothetical protein INT45_011965 [Circinella minor]
MVATTTPTPSTFIVRPPPRSSSLRRPSNNNNRNNNDNDILTEISPRAGWLSKLSQVAYSIGNKKRWQTRFFVLLDTELRCYKNEHTQTPSCVINLRDTCQPVIMTSSSSSGSRPHCFRLEPISNDNGQSNNSRPLTIACQSAKELSDWVTAIQSILYKLNNHHYSQQEICQQRITKKFIHAAEQHQQQQQRNSNDEESISRRRGVLLPPLMVHPLDEIPTNVIVQSPVLSDTTISEDDDEEDIIAEQEEAKITFVAGQRYMMKDNNNNNDDDDNDTVTTSLTRNANTSTSPTGTDRRKLSAYSPTYLLYQERFHLFN